jgi:NADH:ubiquinone oxidoreductase subunit H
MNFISKEYSRLLQGQETTYSALSWAVQLLGDHTDVQVTLLITVLIRLNGYSVLQTLAIVQWNVMGRTGHSTRST